MATEAINQVTQMGQRWPVPLVCPLCRNPLVDGGRELKCMACNREYPLVGEFPDLILGGRFDDRTSESKMTYEMEANTDSARNYLLPLFRSLWPGSSEDRNLLSLGCGTGGDVEFLTQQGFPCIGIDCGKRSEAWQHLKLKHRFLLANGKHLPFSDNTFDGAFSGCVFPHVGVQGDSDQVAPDFFEQRLALAREMLRVLKPGGKILVSSPNRLFPLDLFHGREEGVMRPKVYSPANRFLLSYGDYREIFLHAGGANVRALPVQGYWGFIRSRRSMKGLLLGLPVRFLFWAVSTETFRFLRTSPVNPWLIVLIEKGPQA
jgi:SAM-dependent methyltransferase